MAEIFIDDLKISVADFGIERADTVQELMSGRDVIVEFAKAAWVCTISPCHEEFGRRHRFAGVASALTRLSNWFSLVPPGYTGAEYTATTLTVDGSNQVGYQLNITGGQPGATVLRAGEYFEVNGELKIVVYDVVADGAGSASVRFEPPLRNSPPDGAVLETQEPKVKMRLDRPRQLWSIEAPRLYGYTLDCVEYIV